MIKKYIYLLLALLICFTSCSDKADLADLIPDNVSCVVRINLNSILKKSEIISKEGEYQLPNSLKSIIDKNDTSLFCQLIRNGAATGIDSEESVYFYIPLKGFKCCALTKLRDDDSFANFVLHLTGEDISLIKDETKVVVKDGIVVAQKNKVAFFAITNNNTKKEEATKLASALLNYNGVSVCADEKVKSKLDEDKDITFYMNVANANHSLKRSDLTKRFVKDFPAIRLFMDTDIRNVFGQMQFESSEADINIEIECDEEGEFAQFYNTILSKASKNFLKIVPNNVDGIVAFSVNGANLIKIDEIKGMVKKINAMPFMSKLDLISMFNQVNGSIAVAFTQDSNFDDEYNYVVVAESTNGNEIIHLIKTFASSIGQEPEISNGEYVYAYYNKQIKVGAQENLVYAKILNYEQDSETCEDIEPANKFFSEMNLGLYLQLKNKSVFNIGLDSANTGHGRFIVDENENAAAKFIEVICSIPMKSRYEVDDFGDFIPLEDVNF